MGTTFVTLSRDEAGNHPGFWMSDAMLELWLRLLALHLPEPTGDGQFQATLGVRNQWLLASRGYFMGCVPHGLEDACATDEGKAVVRHAIESLLASLQRARTPLDADALNLLGIEGEFTKPIERSWLEDVAYAFLDLLDGKISSDAASADVMPGSTLYQRDASSR